MPDTEISAGKFTVEPLPPMVAPPSVSTPETLATLGACANCGTPLAGPYCSTCGQHVADFHRSVWRFVADFLDNTICWDNKLLSTLEPLFKQPGFLTREFMRGRRVRYVHPLRLFLFTSAVCLTLLQYGQNSLVIIGPPHKTDRHAKPRVHVNFGDPKPADLALPAPTPSADSATPATARKDAAGESGNVKYDEDDAASQAVRRAVSENVAKSLNGGDSGQDEGGDAISRAVESKINAAGGAEKFSRSITDGVQQRLSWVALALLPVFALGLRAVYWRNDRFYSEHLIFSLHYHTFLLLFWTAYVAVLAVASSLPLHSLFETIVRFGVLAPPLYLYVALRRMYGDGPKRTVVKVLLLGSMHLLAIVIGVAAVGAAAFFSATK